MLAALGVKMTDAELRVALSGVDADGSGDVNFSEFYAWFMGDVGFGGGEISSVYGYDRDEASEFAETKGSDTGGVSHRSGSSRAPSLAGSRVSELSTATALTAMPGRQSARGSRGLRNAARTTFVKVRGS